MIGGRPVTQFAVRVRTHHPKRAAHSKKRVQFSRKNTPDTAGHNLLGHVRHQRSEPNAQLSVPIITHVPQAAVRF
jgi:hypothetical protein